MDEEEKAPRKKLSFKKMHHSMSSSPLICFLIALGCAFLWVYCTAIDIRTTENLFLGIKSTLAISLAEVLTQPLQMFNGGIDAETQMAYAYAWSSELLQLIFAFLLSVAVVKLSSTNATIGKMFVPFGLFFIGMNAYANFMSAPAHSTLMQVLVSGLISGIAVVGLPLAIGFAEYGLSEV